MRDRFRAGVFGTVCRAGRRSSGPKRQLQRCTCWSCKVSEGIFNVSLHMRRLTTYNRGVRDASGILIIGLHGSTMIRSTPAAVLPLERAFGRIQLRAQIYKERTPSRLRGPARFAGALFLSGQCRTARRKTPLKGLPTRRGIRPSPSTERRLDRAQLQNDPRPPDSLSEQSRDLQTEQTPFASVQAEYPSVAKVLVSSGDFPFHHPASISNGPGA
jgi:hypothetical protein